MKLMNTTDTPRTDREMHRIEDDGKGYPDWTGAYIAMLERTRTLERELNEARAEARDMKLREYEMSDFLDGVADSTEEPAIDHMKRFVKERDAARAENDALRNTIIAQRGSLDAAQLGAACKLIDDDSPLIDCPRCEHRFNPTHAPVGTDGAFYCPMCRLGYE